MSFLHRAPRAPRVDLTGRRIVVTGATPGSLGGETARVLTAWGADVVTTTRSGGSHPLDLSDAASVRTFATWYGETYGDELHCLVNNAGVHLDLLGQWKQPQLVEGEEVHWRTNYLGTLHLTSLLLPALLSTQGARVVTVVSKLHARGRNERFTTPGEYSSWDSYGQSKLALVHATTELQRRHGTMGLAACSVDPGSVLTGIAARGLTGHGLLSRIRGALRPIEALALLTPEQGAQTSVLCASTPDLLPAGFYAKCRPAAPSAEAADTVVAAELYDRTLSWIGAHA